MYMVCYRKLLFPWKRGQKFKFGPKIGLFANFSRKLHLIFLIFCMMLDTNKGSSAMYVVCYLKLLFPWKQDQKVKFGPKIRFFANFSRTLHLIFLIFGPPGTGGVHSISVCPYVRPFVRPSVRPSVRSSVRPFVRPSVRQFF